MLQTTTFSPAAPAREIGNAEWMQEWLYVFEDAVHANDRAAHHTLRVEEAHWRALLAFACSVTSTSTREEIVSTLLREQPQAQSRDFGLANAHASPRCVKRAGVDVIKAIIQIKTATGRCLGVMYKSMPQKGLWFIGGEFAQRRVWSRYVALQIKASELRIVDYDIPVEPTIFDILMELALAYRDTVPSSNGAGAGARTDEV